MKRLFRCWLAQAFALARASRLAGILIAMQGNPGFHAASAGDPNPGYPDLLTHLLTQLREETLTFPGQVGLVHGDTHQHRINQPMLDPANEEAVRNFTRVESMGSPFFGWVR